VEDGNNKQPPIVTDSGALSKTITLLINKEEARPINKEEARPT